MDPASRAANRALFSDAYSLQNDAEMAYNSGQLAQAEQDAKQALDAAPIAGGQKVDMPGAECVLGRIYLAEGDPKKALDKFLIGAPHHSDNTIKLDVALAYVRLGQYAKAEEAAPEQTIADYHLSDDPLLPGDLPGSADAKSLEATILFARGLTELYDGQSELAPADFAAAGKLAPNSIVVTYYLGRSLIRRQRYAEAEPLIQKVVSSPRGAIFHTAANDLYQCKAVLSRQSVTPKAPSATPRP